MPTKESFNAPAAEYYAEALQHLLSLSKYQTRILQVHYHAPERTITATQLAQSLGHNNYFVANAHYGRLARIIGEVMDYNPEPERLGTLVLFEKRDGEWHWIMRPELAKALESLGWVEKDNLFIPEEITETEKLIEGAVHQVKLNAYERNAVARKKCLDYYGYICRACFVDLESIYGELGHNYIHVHHKVPLSEIKETYQIDPINDLVPVCPNCHAMLHRPKELLTVEELRAIIESNRG